MVNVVCLLFSLVAVAFLVVRAAMLDRMLPWFKPPPEKLPSLRPSLGSGRRYTR